LQVLGKMLVGEVFGIQLMCCRLKGQDAVTKFMIVLNNAMDGQDTDKYPFSFYDRNGKLVEVLLTANKRTDGDGYITGVFCFLHIASPELLQVRFSSLNACSKVLNLESSLEKYICSHKEPREVYNHVHFTRYPPWNHPGIARVSPR
jgi:hypothetical protein